ncbi:MAG: YheC/YheD family protein, partial [Alicyclobacillus sp.]|nr:YheC/YheD family protein [Alicyclobacillus sp.]
MRTQSTQPRRTSSLTARLSTVPGQRLQRRSAASRQARPALRTACRRGRKPELGKYALWRWFARHNQIRRFLPQTERYSPAALQRLLHAYGAVFVKPSAGSRGRGVMKVWRAQGRYWVHHTVRRPRTFWNGSELVRWLARVQGGRRHIVQQAIDVVRLHGRPV